MGDYLVLAKAITSKLWESDIEYDTLDDVCKAFLLFSSLHHNLAFGMCSFSDSFY